MSVEVSIPRHVAIIMDGNGRWAERQGLARVRGHECGVERVRELVRYCGEAGVQAVTLYGFSTENWSRPEEEVEFLMTLLQRYLYDELDELQEQGVCLRAIGELGRLSAPVQQALEHVRQATQGSNKLTLCLALSYGSRLELVAAARALAEKAAKGEVSPLDITESSFDEALYTEGLPPLDLVIRTGGEMRLSNFLLWQSAYAELYFTDVMWPDFDVPCLEGAFEDFAKRQRRFGKTGGQLGVHS